MNKEKENKQKKYPVYKNDLLFKKMRNINADMALWYTDDLKDEYEKDFDNITARLKMCKENNFIYLDLSRLDLEKIPKLSSYSKFDELTNVKYLFLNDNKLTTCGDRLEYFPNLEVLDVSHNAISEVTFLPNTLKEFICTNNKINSLPSHKNLKILDCTSNKINDLGTYPKLKDLNCSNNKIKIIKSYDSITRLICRQNPLIEIQNQNILEDLDCSETLLNGKINGLPNLKGLICNHTKINDITSLSKLETLEIVNCKMKIPYLPKLKCLMCEKIKNDNDDIKLSNKLKIKNVVNDGSVLCIIFDSFE